MEHAISDVTEPLIVDRLGDPVVSPFGYPIPGTNHGHPLSGRRLSAVEAGARARIERVYEEEEELLRFFHEEGIRPNVEFTVSDVAPVPRHRHHRLASNGRELVLGLEAAHRIWVWDED